MSDPDEDLLVTDEGVDEGSAASTVEGAGLWPGDGDVVRGGTGPPGEQPAPPVDVDTEEARQARALAPGQQLEVGEG